MALYFNHVILQGLNRLFQLLNKRLQLLLRLKRLINQPDQLTLADISRLYPSSFECQQPGFLQFSELQLRFLELLRNFSIYCRLRCVIFLQIGQHGGFVLQLLGHNISDIRQGIVSTKDHGEFELLIDLTYKLEFFVFILLQLLPYLRQLCGCALPHALCFIQ